MDYNWGLHGTGGELRYRYAHSDGWEYRIYVTDEVTELVYYEEGLAKSHISFPHPFDVEILTKALEMCASKAIQVYPEVPHGTCVS